MQFIQTIFRLCLWANLLCAATCSIATPISTHMISKLVVIADVHADIYRFRNILQDANIIDADDKWIAEPNTVVVQLGDQIDPKYPLNDNHHFQMIYFTETLRKTAIEKHSNFISMIGNHELMNIEKIKQKSALRDIIASRPVIQKLDHYLFCHGMFNKYHYFLMDIYNKTIDDVNDIWSKYVLNIPMATLSDEIILNKLILDTENSILYDRAPDIKYDINKVFNAMDIDYMFVGHTITDYIHLKDKIWYLDLLLKDAFEKLAYAYIVIKDGDIIVKQLSQATHTSFFEIDSFI